MLVEKNGAVSTGAASWPAKSSTYCSASSTKFGIEHSRKDWDTDSGGLGMKR